MRLSTRGRYGTRALLDIAIHRENQPILLRDIAQRQQISLSYLERLVATLVRGGILRSKRSIGGGVSLAKSPEEIRLSEVIELLDGPFAPVNCVIDAEACNRSELCITRNVWSELKQVVDRFFESYTLQDLIERQAEIIKCP